MKKNYKVRRLLYTGFDRIKFKSKQDVYALANDMLVLHHQVPMAEFGFAVSSATVRDEQWQFWLELIAHLNQSGQELPFSLYLSSEWTADLYFDRPTEELSELLRLTFADETPVFRRIYLDCRGKIDFSAIGWESIAQRYPFNIFVFQAKQANVVEALYQRDKVDNAEILCNLANPQVQTAFKPSKLAVERLLRAYLEPLANVGENRLFAQALEALPIDAPEGLAIDFAVAPFPPQTDYTDVCICCKMVAEMIAL